MLKAKPRRASGPACSSTYSMRSKCISSATYLESSCAYFFGPDETLLSARLISSQLRLPRLTLFSLSFTNLVLISGGSHWRFHSSMRSALSSSSTFSPPFYKPFQPQHHNTPPTINISDTNFHLGNTP